MLNDIFIEDIDIKDNFIFLHSSSNFKNQQQINDVFSEKWAEYENTKEKEKFYEMQKNGI